MQRIPVLIQKLTELSVKGDSTIIDIDLMLDYTRVIYADLLEMRNRIALSESLEQGKAIQRPAPAPEMKEEPLPEQPLPEAVIEKPMPAPAEEIPSLKQEINRDIRTLIGINDKYQFISELFGNDKAAYDETLDAVNMMDTYQAVEEWLQSRVARNYGWDDESMTAQMFYGVLSRFFSSM